MHKPNISSGSVLAKLVNILNEDVEQLDHMLQNRDSDSKSYNLINSMKEAKHNILALIPDDLRGASEIPTTGQLYAISGYNSNNDTIDLQDEGILTKMFHKVEEGQYEYVKYALRSDGLANGVVEILEKALDKYTSIVTQLERAKSTNQTNIIV